MLAQRVRDLLFDGQLLAERCHTHTDDFLLVKKVSLRIPRYRFPYLLPSSMPYGSQSSEPEYPYQLFSAKVVRGRPMGLLQSVGGLSAAAMARWRSSSGPGNQSVNIALSWQLAAVSAAAAAGRQTKPADNAQCRHAAGRPWRAAAPAWLIRANTLSRRVSHRSTRKPQRLSSSSPPPARTHTDRLLAVFNSSTGASKFVNECMNEYVSYLDSGVS